MLLALMMVISLSLSAAAADNDPNITAYNNQFTYVVERTSIPLSGTSINIYAVPADSYWSPTHFDTEAAAASITWTRAAGSTPGITMGSVSAHEIDDGKYASCLTVNLSGVMSHGPASFRAVNSSGGYVDITVIVTVAALNDSSLYYTGQTKLQIYDPNGTLYQDTADTISAANHTDERSYVTVMDALVKMQNMGIVNSFAESYGYVSSITINNNLYEASGVNGWQFRIYNDSNYDGVYELVPASALLGAADMSVTLLSGGYKLVQWRFGSYYDTTLFPQLIAA